MHPYIANLARRTFTAVTGITPKSLQSDLKYGEEVVYTKLGTTVTADWLEFEMSSYPIRHLRKITRDIKAPPRIEAGIVCLIALFLGFWLVLRIIDETPPVAWNWLLLILSALLLLVASYYTFFKKTVYSLLVTIAYEKKPLKILCETRADLDNLNTALLDVMENYRGHLEVWPDREGTATNEAVW